MKYLSKFVKTDTDFLGWRLSLCREKRQFVRYFSALEWGGMEQAEAVARRMREALLADLATSKESVQEIFARYRKATPHLPYGITLLNPGQKRSRPKACSLEFGPCAGEQLETLSARWGITTSSIARIAVYLFYLRSTTEEWQNMDLKELVKLLTEEADGKELPSFDAFWKRVRDENE